MLLLLLLHFQYLTDDAGNVVTEGVALFSGDGGTGFFNYMYNGIVNSSAIEIIAFLMVVGGAFGIMIRTGADVYKRQTRTHTEQGGCPVPYPQYQRIF